MNPGRAVGDLQPQRPPYNSSGQRTFSRQIVTLGFLSEELPSSFVSRQLAAAVFAEMKGESPVIFVRFAATGASVPSESTSRPSPPESLSTQDGLPLSSSSADEEAAKSIPELYLNGEFH